MYPPYFYAAMARFRLTEDQKKAVTEKFERWVQNDPMAQGYVQREGRGALFDHEWAYITKLIELWAQQV
eukprot:1553079-Rhodomonas_salina.1